MDRCPKDPEALEKFFEAEIWPQIPESLRGLPVTKAMREEILGVGPQGYCE